MIYVYIQGKSRLKGIMVWEDKLILGLWVQCKI